MSNLSQSVLEYQRSPLYRLAASPYPEWSLSAICAASLPAAARSAPAMPHLGVMMGFSAVFAGSGYMKYMNDAENGSGTTTSWCLLYLFLNLKRTVQQPKPMPSLLLAGVMTNLVISGRKTIEYQFGV
ncbi:hypothetical protein CPC16_002760 [Podila verticillata]|nr:hypothetical protein BGZ52_011918 [Haplosporangium bisporale]KAF9393023.1 hypothetical protein CPC16_002760 [Podila verticillata]KAI9237023.1 MAG: hypothetical protein BYD32DRAFT_313167 [Podila humilis]KFH67373.1 hypothetical protein MVEG_06107 [Podila verticillata NRRL 6337]